MNLAVVACRPEPSSFCGPGVHGPCVPDRCGFREQPALLLSGLERARLTRPELRVSTALRDALACGDCPIG
ncbi:hypothetical protein [Kibdelosporangium philippinense]|uniref:hypothetical protein n=1 Tax=Kibdelosporangium philippinense TaxID=211113 RepID=UPI003612130B